MRPVASHEAFVGALVTWLHVPRGGYGYEYPVDAKIIALNLLMAGAGHDAKAAYPSLFGVFTALAVLGGVIAFGSIVSFAALAP